LYNRLLNKELQRYYKKTVRQKQGSTRL